VQQHNILSRATQLIFLFQMLFSRCRCLFARLCALFPRPVVHSQLVPTLTVNWSGTNTSVGGVTAALRAAKVDMVIMVSSFDTGALRLLVEHWRDVDFMPLVIAWTAGGHKFLPAELLSYMLVEVLWLPGLTGAVHHAVDTESNLELFSANFTHDSPAVFADAFTRRFPLRTPNNTDWYHPARALHSMAIIQKMVELAQSNDIETLRLASARIASPGVFHAIQFDQWGRSLPYDNFIIQLQPDGRERIATPLSIGQRATLPMPTWEERVFAPRFLSSSGERVMYALSALGVLYLLSWLAWGAYWRQHPVIGASAPAFSALALVGFILFLSSNFVNTMYATDATCATTVWLFMVGFTIATGSLLLKNLRIWALWHNRSHSFAPAKLRQPHLMAALLLLVLIDVSLNIAWQAGPGMHAVRVMVDPDRPSLDYFMCERSDTASGFIVAHVSVKGVMLLSGVLLAWKLRKVSAQFSESRFIALSIYNSALLLILINVMWFTNVGGHAVSLLVRTFCTLYLAVSTATIMALPKLLAIRSTEARIREAMAAHVAAVARAAEGVSQSALVTLPPPPHDDVADPQAAAVHQPVRSGPVCRQPARQRL